MFAPPGRRPVAPERAGPRKSTGRASEGSRNSLGEKDSSPRSPHEESSRRDDRPMTVHEASRAKKAIERNRKAIENRIRYFQKEEEKIWRDLEEVRRQAATIEEGRSRTIEKKLADRAIQQEKDLTLQHNRVKVSTNRVSVSDYRKQQQFEAMREKQLAAQAQRETSQAILHQKKQLDLEMRKQNSERAAMIQIAQKEARSRASQERSLRLERMREFQEFERQQAEQEVLEAESTLPDLEEQEMICLQRLQNSRIVTQSVLEELETRLGSQSSVATLLRSKQRSQDPLDSVGGLSTGLPQEPEATAETAHEEAAETAAAGETLP